MKEKDLDKTLKKLQTKIKFKDLRWELKAAAIGGMLYLIYWIVGFCTGFYEGWMGI